MLYLKPLSAVTQNELQAVGFRAQDLALLAGQRLRTPPSLVLLSNAFEQTMQENNLKYKIDYILDHAMAGNAASLTNAYTGARKAIMDAKLPKALETELKDTLRVLAATEKPLRIILSTNRLEDPESNDTIIQNIRGTEELIQAVREAWAFIYLPSQLEPRLREKYPEIKLKVAMIIQVMDSASVSTHAYSSLPQDHGKVYLQVYNGELDLRGKVTKDYYAINKDMLHIALSEVREQAAQLEMHGAELTLTPRPSTGKGDKLIHRELQELARLTKNAERTLQTAVKIFFASRNELHDLLWVNRLGFEVMGDKVTEEVAAPHEAHDVPMVLAQEAPAAPVVHGVAPIGARLLEASLKLAHGVIVSKYRNAFPHEELRPLAEMVARLNHQQAFAHHIDAKILDRAEELVRSNGAMPEAEYAHAVEEIATILHSA